MINEKAKITCLQAELARKVKAEILLSNLNLRVQVVCQIISESQSHNYTSVCIKHHLLFSV